MEINELIPGRWYNPTERNTNYYYKYIRTGEGNEIIADYFTVDINKIIKKEASITNSDFWRYAKEMEYSEIEPFIPFELKEKHCEYLIHN